MSLFSSAPEVRSTINVLMLTSLAPLSWGTTYIVTTELLPPDRPLLAGFARALPAGMAINAFTRMRPRGVWWYRTAVLGALYIGIFFPLLFIAAGRLPGGVAAIFGAIGPLITLGLAAMLLHEAPTRRKVLCGAVGVVGVALVVTSGQGRIDTVGAIAGTAGAVSMATATVLTKRWGRPSGVGALTFTGWQLTAGGMLIAPLLLVFEGLPSTVDASNVVGWIYLAAGNTALAYWLWFRGLDRLPANSVAFLGLLSPLAAVTIGWLALGQSLSVAQFVGLAMALSAAVVGATNGNRIHHRSPTVEIRNRDTGAPSVEVTLDHDSRLSRATVLHESERRESAVVTPAVATTDRCGRPIAWNRDTTSDVPTAEDGRSASPLWCCHRC